MLRCGCCDWCHNQAPFRMIGFVWCTHVLLWPRGFAASKVWTHAPSAISFEGKKTRHVSLQGRKHARRGNGSKGAQGEDALLRISKVTAMLMKYERRIGSLRKISPRFTPTPLSASLCLLQCVYWWDRALCRTGSLWIANWPRSDNRSPHVTHWYGTGVNLYFQGFSSCQW